MRRICFSNAGDVVHVVRIPQRQWHLADVAADIGVILPQFLLRRRLVVVREVAQEEEGQHVVAEVVRIHRPAQLVGDAPEGVAQLFLIFVGHDAGVSSGAGAASDEARSGIKPG